MSDGILPELVDDELIRPESPDLEQELVDFRYEWRRELCKSSNIHNQHTQEQIEHEAARLFILGSEAERSGAFYEAIILYKRAMHLVPDIESKIEHYNRNARERQDSETSLDEHSFPEEQEDECLLSQFQEMSVGDKTFCQPKVPHSRLTHISCLPLELIIYIFRWVLSSDLDIHSMENLSLVCRGFYVCTRDEEMWRLACEKVWGKNMRSPRKYGGSWRTMFIEKPHPLFHGCYISRTGYVRHGEQSLDNFYRPFHLVYYYRIVRFFPGGKMLMVCTPEEPNIMVTRMRDPTFNQQGAMFGCYKLHKNKVNCILKREASSDTNYHRYKRRPQQKNEAESTFYVEFEVVNSGRQSHTKLMWCNYFNRVGHKTTGEEITNNFDLNQKNFPPLIFSRVKSYTAMSETVLQ